MGFNLAKIVFLSLIVTILFVGCSHSPTLKAPSQLTCPTPIEGNSGKYMCPFTSDDVLAEWTDKAINTKIGATVGKTAGAFAGQKALEQIPFFGAFLGAKAGEAAGRAIAVQTAGGMDYIKETSDISFNSVDNMAVYLYVKYSTHEHYQSALDAAMEIYPALKKGYYPALVSASNNT